MAEMMKENNVEILMAKKKLQYVRRRNNERRNQWMKE